MKEQHVEAQVPARAEADPAFQWKLTSLFNSEAEWESVFQGLENLVVAVEQFRGRLNDPEVVADFLEAESQADRALERLYTFAHLKKDEDTAEPSSQAREARVRSKWAGIAGRLAWASPEILANPLDVLESWLEHPRLSADRYLLTKIIRQKKHVLSEAEETLLSKASEIFSAPSQAYSMLTDADMRFPPVEDESGLKRELTQERYPLFLKSRDRAVRKRAFETMYDTFGGFKNSIATMLGYGVKTHNYFADVRRHDSALAGSLFGDQIPVSLYESLIDAVHRSLPRFYKYVDLRADRLGLQDLDMYDMYVPIVPDLDVKVPYARAVEWVLAACEPLGTDYVETMRAGIAHGWIDVFENRGKRSGAYSSGCYDSHPYVLLNYQGTLNDVFTLAHELGHSMHSRLANQTQPFRSARYTIFVAEIASTLNEALLLDYLLERENDPAMRAYLLNHYCDGVKGTVFRQTMFAEFEKMMHEMDASGQPLTAEALTQAYYPLNAKYYGPRVKADERIGLEWMRIPHFYYNFYVYKYATSFCASQIFARRVKASASGRDLYLGLLRAGGSNDPLKLVQAAGVDLSDPETMESALLDFEIKTGELRKAL